MTQANYVRIWDRKGNEIVTPDGMQIQARYYSYSALYGPDRAEIELAGGEALLWSTMEWTGYRVAIYNETNDLAWHGFVNDVHIGNDGMSLDNMYNSVAVRYGNPEGGERPITNYATNQPSIDQYGIKEHIVDAPDILTIAPAEAVAQRSALLHSRPTPLKPNGPQIGGRLGMLYCYGPLIKAAWRMIPESTGIEGHPDDSEDIIRVGNSAVNSQHHQKFTVQGATFGGSSVWVKMSQTTNTPTFNVTVNLRNDAAGTPGSIIDTGTITSASLPADNELHWIEVTFPGGPILVSGTTYWLEFITTGTHPNRNYALGIDQSGGYQQGFYAETGFINTGWDCLFAFYDTIDSGEWAAELLRTYGDVRSVTLVQPSGFVDIRYVARDQNAGAKILSLLGMGTDDQKYYFVYVTFELDVYIYATDGSNTEAFRMLADGQLEHAGGQRIPNSLAPTYVGVFIIRGDVNPVANYQYATSIAFVERIDWRAGQVSIYPLYVGYGGLATDTVYT